MFTFGAPYYTYISDEYAVAKRELGIVKEENELMPVFNSRRDYCISSAEYYGPDQERIKFNFSITLTKDQQNKAGAHVENLKPGITSRRFYAIFPMLKSDDDGELCVLPLFKGRIRKSQKIIKNPST